MCSRENVTENISDRFIEIRLDHSVSHRCTMLIAMVHADIYVQPLIDREEAAWRV